MGGLFRSIAGAVGLGPKKPPPTLVQPTPNDPGVAMDQQKKAAMIAQTSGRASTILSQPNQSDSLG